MINETPKICTLGPFLKAKMDPRVYFLLWKMDPGVVNGLPGGPYIVMKFVPVGDFP